MLVPAWGHLLCLGGCLEARGYSVDYSVVSEWARLKLEYGFSDEVVGMACELGLSPPELTGLSAPPTDKGESNGP